MTGADKTTEAGQPGPLGIVLSTDGLGAGAEARCWCHTCRPITFADMRMVLCPTCGDKRCLHALSHAAPCAKTDLYAHNAWVERILLRSQRAPENSAPDEVGMTALGAWGAPNVRAKARAHGVMTLEDAPAVNAVGSRLERGVMALPPKRATAGLRVVPCSLRDAQRYVASLHRHHKDQPLPGHKLSLAVEAKTRMLDGPEWVRVGVAMIGNPSAPALQKDPLLVEIRRVCTDGTPNACSMLYGAARRALRAIGYETIITYTLPEEGGASLRAAGFILDKADAGGCAADWHNRRGRRALPVGDDLIGGKWRWLG